LYMEDEQMAARVLQVNRSDLRQNQSRWLKKARGQRVLLVRANDEADQKVVLDKRYYDQIRRQMESLVETLEITMDRRLFNQILATADTLEKNLRSGKLHSLEDAFAEE